jgi:hypothetical protein
VLYKLPLNDSDGVHLSSFTDCNINMNLVPNILLLINKRQCFTNCCQPPFECNMPNWQPVSALEQFHVVLVWNVEVLGFRMLESLAGTLSHESQK